MTSSVSIAFATSSSMQSASLSSDFLITLRFGFVTGCLATNIVQQSSYGRIEVSKVPIFSDMAIISCLSKPIKGLKTGSVHTSFVTESDYIV